MRFARFVALGLAALALSGRACRAGMPSYTLADLPRVRTLADLARMRLEVISFFFLALLLLTAALQALWNGLRRDFPRLPRLSYPRALGLMILWGLLFMLVLTMISGARELMTPGAWEKVGATYRLAPDPPPVEAEIEARHEAITRLAHVLFEGRTDGRFPPREAVDDLLWVVPGAGGANYVYLGGAAYVGDDSNEDEDGVLFNRSLPRLLVVEPEAAGEARLAILRGGEIRWVSVPEVAALSRPTTEEAR